MAAWLLVTISLGIFKTASSFSSKASKILRNPGLSALSGCLWFILLLHHNSDDVLLRDLPTIDHDLVDGLRTAWWRRQSIA